MHYGINPLLLSMQKLGPRRRCACCCLSHYCHCAIWAMLSCHVISSILHTLTGPVYGASSRVLSSLFPLSSSGRSRSWVSVSIRLFPHCHCSTTSIVPVVTPRRHRDSSHSDKHHNTSGSTTNTPSTTTYLSTKTSQMKNESQAVTWIRYITVPKLLKLQQNTGTGHWT